MEQKQLATILKDYIVKNDEGETVTLAEDFSNLNEYAKAVENLTEDDLKDLSKTLAVGVVKNIFDTKSIDYSDLGIRRDSQEYAGAIQIIRMSMANFTPIENVLFTLENGTDYYDGKYYGAEPDANVLLDSESYSLPWSIPHTKFKSMFKSSSEVMSYVSMIEQTVQNYLKRASYNLDKRVILDVAVQALKGNREVPLCTMYNNEMGLTGGDVVTELNYRKYPDFIRWAQMQIELVTERLRDVSDVYNDGSIETFSRLDELKMYMLTEWEKAVKFEVLSDTYHDDKLSLSKNARTVNYWQNHGTGLNPHLGVTAEIKVKEGEDTTTYSNIICISMDEMAGGTVSVLDKVTSGYIPRGDFTNYYANITNRRFVNKKANAVVFTLN